MVFGVFVLLEMSLLFVEIFLEKFVLVFNNNGMVLLFLVGFMLLLELLVFNGNGGLLLFLVDVILLLELFFFV